MAPTDRRGWLRVGTAVVWILVAFEVLALGLAGYAKFGSSDVWTSLFVEWGYPGWFSFVIGGAEMGGVLLLLVPRLASYAAAVLILIMIGALWTVVSNGSELGPVAPVVHAVALSIILWLRWDRRWRPESAERS